MRPSRGAGPLPCDIAYSSSPTAPTCAPSTCGCGACSLSIALPEAPRGREATLASLMLAMNVLAWAGSYPAGSPAFEAVPTGRSAGSAVPLNRLRVVLPSGSTLRQRTARWCRVLRRSSVCTDGSYRSQRACYSPAALRSEGPRGGSPPAPWPKAPPRMRAASRGRSRAVQF
jgi:hypothetical protein